MMGLFSLAGAVIAQSQAVDAAAGGAARAESKTTVLQRQAKILEANLAKLLMICEALWELLRDTGGLTDEQLHKKLYEIDMRDGVLDGKNQRKALECPNCRHMVSPRHPACLYCGQIIDDSVFGMS